MVCRRREQPIDRVRLEELYLGQHLSLAEIATRLGCSVNKVVYWMDRYQIPRRRQDEANYIKHHPEGDPFQIKELETDDERELFQVVIGLYIGEGRKNPQRVSLSNSDPKVIRTFLRFLREICRVEESKLFAWLNIFDDVDVKEAQAYWEQVTNLPRERFYKPTIRPSKGKNYQSKSRYGTLTVGISNAKLSRQISQWYKSALDKFSA